MLHLFKLIRIKNLAIVFAAQYFMHAFIIKSILGVDNLESQIGSLNFILLATSTIFLCAAGYIINDYFDTKTDNINHPDSVVVGRYIKRRVAMILHFSLNFLGVLIGFVVSYRIGKTEYIFVFFFVTLLLWGYSVYFKRKPVVGNLIVSFLTALVPLAIIIFEIPNLRAFYQNVYPQIDEIITLLIYWVAGYSCFAFILNFIREVLKDMVDIEGDKESGYRTIPVVFGKNITKYLILGLIIIVIIAVAFVNIIYLSDIKSFMYIISLIILPLLYVVYKLFREDSKKGYYFLSEMINVIMLAGILYSVVARIIINEYFITV